MATSPNLNPLIVIVGPTASGKSSLAMALAKKINGELICADSRTIYKGMDIGTAKPTASDQKKIPHHMLNVATPDQPYSAAKFKEAVLLLIKDISGRGKIPIMVGGTGLYIDSVIYDFAFLPQGSQDDREHLQSLTVEQLQKMLTEKNIPLPENNKNPRHLIRALETNGAVAVKKDLRSNTLLIGVDRSKEEVIQSIRARIEIMVRSGLEAEVLLMAERYGWDSPGLHAVGYREWQGGVTQNDAIQAIESNTIQYAKRQRTWFKRNPHICWVKNVAQAEPIVHKFLQNK